MDWHFDGEVIEWRGPSPYFFVTIPPDDSDEIKEAGRDLVYWGQVPVVAVIGGTEFRTALFPKEDVYALPLRVAVRRKAGLEVGDVASVQLRLHRR